jgi:hypothetical protein
MVFKSHEVLEKAIDLMKLSGQKILDIQSPHYIYIKTFKESKKETKFGIIAGISGFIGFILVSLVIFYVMGNPHLLLGNKSALPVMSYVPVLFTLSILFSALGLVLAFSIKHHLLPGQQNQVTDKKASDDHYVLIISKKLNRKELENMLGDIKTESIFEHTFIEQNINLPLPLKIK